MAIEAIESAPALASFGEVMKAPIGNIVNEGPVRGGFMEGFRPMNITDITTIDPGGTVAPLGEILFQAEPVNILDGAGAVAEAESILAMRQVEEPKQFLVEPRVDPQLPFWEVIAPQVMPQVEQMVAPWVLPGILPVVQPAVEAQPQLQTQAITKIENQISAAVAPTVLPHPALQEQDEKEEVITEKITREQIDTVEEEEIEVSELKDVVDEEVLNIRLEEFSSAADLVGAEVKEEIDGKKIVERIPAETEANRSGLIKKRGPDGSREETIGEIASRKFRSIGEAKEKIAAIIAQKVPVKRAKEGMAVGYEAVARVLKYFFVKVKPAEQLVSRVVKKQKTLPVVSVAKPDVKELRIEDLGLVEVFQKAA